MADDSINAGSRRLTAYVDPEVLEAAKRAAFWTPGLTLSGLAEEALCREVARLEAERGEPFPDRRGELPRGRGLE